VPTSRSSERNAQPIEVVARSAASIFPHQAAAFGRALHALVVGFDSAQRRVDEAAHIEKLEDASGPGGSCSPPSCRSCVVTVRPSGSVRPDSTDRDAASQTIEALSAEIIAAGGMPNRTPRSRVAMGAL